MTDVKELEQLSKRELIELIFNLEDQIDDLVEELSTLQEDCS